jgi:hypothetical protein
MTVERKSSLKHNGGSDANGEDSRSELTAKG